MGRVFQRKRASDGTKYSGWHARWTDEHGKRWTRKVGDTRREAREFLDEREREVRAKKNAPAWQRAADGSGAFGAFVEEYLAKMVKGRLRAPRGREIHLERWVEELGAETPLREVSPDAVAGFLAYLGSKKRPVKPATRNRYLASLRHALNTAVEWGRLPASPIGKVKPVPEENERTRVISPAEEAALLAAAAGSHVPALGRVITLALETTARPDELLALRWADVDEARRLVAFRHTKSGRTRQVPLTSRALDAIGKRPRGGGWLFTHGGERLTGQHVRRAFEDACETAGLPYGRDVEGGLIFRDTRRTAITRLAERGVPAAVIQKWSGHATLAMVQRYTEISDAAVRAVAELLDAERQQFGDKQPGEPSGESP